MNKLSNYLVMFFFISGSFANAQSNVDEQLGRNKIMLAVMADLSGRILGNMSGAQGDLHENLTETIDDHRLSEICSQLGGAETAASLLLKYANSAYSGVPDYNFENQNKEIRTIQDLHKKLYHRSGKSAEGLLPQITKLVKLACRADSKKITVQDLKSPINSITNEAYNFFIFLALLTIHNNR